MLTIPIQPVPSQTTKIILGGQNCQLYIYQKPQGLFVDINVNGVDIVICVQAHDGVPLACREYAGILGNILFIDTQGVDDPYYTGLGSRYVLVYLSEVESALL